MEEDDLKNRVEEPVSAYGHYTYAELPDLADG